MTTALTWIWFAGGVLLIPFNTLVPGFLLSLRFGIDYAVWIRWVKLSWVCQIIWNIVFFSASLILGYAETGKVEYSLKRTHPEGFPELNVWTYRFYSNGKEIADDSEKATPFQRDMEATGYQPQISIMKAADFNELSYFDARAYIDQYNAAHGSTAFEDVLVAVGAAVVFPFLWLLPELFIAMILACPIVSAIVFGPSVLRVLSELGFFTAIRDLFR
jgi:hypothetical protein